MLTGRGGDRQGIAECLDALAALAAAEGRGETAARLFGAAEAIRGELGLPSSPPYVFRVTARASDRAGNAEQAGPEIVIAIV